jgi:uncharacterized membrane protein YfcA
MAKFGPQVVRTEAVCAPRDALASLRVTGAIKVMSQSASSAWATPRLVIDQQVHRDSTKPSEASKPSSEFAAAPLWVRLAVSAAVIVMMLAIAAGITSGFTSSAMVIVFAAAGLSSIGGFAFSALCGALLLHVMAPVAAVQLMMVCSIGIQSLSVFALRAATDWRLLSRFLLGGVVGLPVGIYLLLHVDRSAYCQILGGFLIFYGCYMLLRPATMVHVPWKWADPLAGFLGGVTGGFAGFPGAFVTIWCALKGGVKDRQRGVYQPFILIMQLLALMTLFWIETKPGYDGFSQNLNALLYVPAALLGTWCGLGWYRRLSDRQFAIIVNALLITSGFAFLL